MKRAGLMDSNDQINNQQVSSAIASLTPQQALYYLPQLAAQQSQLTNYVAPKRQLSTQQYQKYEQPQQKLQQYQSQQKHQSKPQSDTKLYSDSSLQTKNLAQEDAEKDTSSKTLSKADRQGLYGHENIAYQDSTAYSGGHAGYGNDGFSDHQDSYSGGGHYGHEQVAYKPPVYIPKPSVAINLDPLGFLRLLLQGIPRPLLNLNGKVFFGVELGKNAGIGIKGGSYGHAPAPAYGGGGKGIVLNLG